MAMPIHTSSEYNTYPESLGALKSLLRNPCGYEGTDTTDNSQAKQAFVVENKDVKFYLGKVESSARTGFSDFQTEFLKDFVSFNNFEILFWFFSIFAATYLFPAKFSNFAQKAIHAFRFFVSYFYKRKFYCDRFVVWLDVVTIFFTFSDIRAILTFLLTVDNFIIHNLSVDSHKMITSTHRDSNVRTTQMHIVI